MATASDDLMLWTVVAYSLAMLAFAVEFAAGRRSRLGSRRVEAIGLVGVGITVLGWMLHVASAVTRGLAVHRAPWGNLYEFSMMASLIAVTLFLALLHRWQLRRLGAFVLAPLILYLGLAGTVLYARAGSLPPALHSYWIWIHVAAAISATGAFMFSGFVTVLYLLKERWERGLPPLRVTLLAALHIRPVRRPAAGPTAATSPAQGAPEQTPVGAGVSMGPGTAAVAEFRWPSGLMEALPDSSRLERAAHRVITFAFPIWTFAIIAGAIWANAAWSRAWGWDPKETWSFITWLAYAAYLHARATGGWRGRRAATVSLVGLGCLIVNFYVVNTVVVGLHSYAGL
jgi:cytochrome c-type biogenesis protein CcsB